MNAAYYSRRQASDSNPGLTLEPLYAYRQFLRTSKPFSARQCSDFSLLARYDRGEDITPVLKERHEIGFNMLRVWTLMALKQYGIDNLNPCPYAKIPKFLSLCESWGFYVEFTAYTDIWDPNHWPNLGAACQAHPNVLLEFANEKHATFGSEKRISGILCSHGSGGGGEIPVQPYWDYVTFHTNGQFEEQRKIGHNAMELWNGPTLTNEISRYPEVGMWVGANLERQKRLAYDSAAGAALLCAGACFHSVYGKSSQLFDSNHKVVATEWVHGSKSVNLTSGYQDSPYVHRIDLEQNDPTALRIYQRVPELAVIHK